MFPFEGWNLEYEPVTGSIHAWFIKGGTRFSTTAFNGFKTDPWLTLTELAFAIRSSEFQPQD